MKSLNFLKLLVGTFFAILATTAHSQNWNPAKSSRIPFDRLEASLDGAQSVLYLDNSCKVVAFVVPNDPESYVFPTRQVRTRWDDRTPIYHHPAGGCPNTSITFLDADMVSGGNPNACKPNVLVTDADLTGVTCRINRNIITSIVVLDPLHSPLLIVEGKLAHDAAPDTVPATVLGRTSFQIGNPCSPTTPCTPPKAGTMKNINGQLVCVCQ